MKRKDRQTIASAAEGSHSSFQNCLTSLISLAILLASLLLLNACAGLVSVGNTTASSTLTITNVQAVSTTTSATQISWTTDTASNSLVNYGTTTSYGSNTPVDPTMVTSHQVTISGLSAGTTYYYQVQSTDSKNNNGKSGGHKFGTMGVSISGTIAPTNSGNGATVTLSGIASATTTANGSGAYTFATLASGSYVVTPTNPGYSFSPASQNVTLGTTNMTGVNFSATATTTAPTIAVQPSNQAVTTGQTATFSVVANGTAPLSYQWQKNGANIAGATSSSYTTPATAASDSGSTFDVVVSNSVGTVTSTAATLTVNPAPVAPTITTQPANQMVAAGQTATFTVTATGTTPLSYQWQKNGANISGATSSSYTTPATTTADSGSTLDVVVSNSAGTVTSSAATLTVNAPAISLSSTSISFVNDVIGSTMTQPLTITNTGTATLTITQINESGSTFFSTTGYSLPLNINAGKQSTITIGFLPTVAGTVSGGLSIVSNAPTSPTAVTLSGTGVAATFTLGINPTTLGFGNVNVGSSSSQNVTVTNTGNSNVTISGITTSGAGFSVSGLSANTTLAPGQSATLSVAFAPTSAGSVSGSVSVASNATNSPAVATLSGSGVSSTSALPTCGKLNDTNVYLPPNYDTFVPPAKGGSYIDPVFGCKITRITDAVSMGWVSANHFYNTVTPFNANDTYLYLFNGYNGGPPMITDLSGNTIVPSSNMPGSNSAIMVWDTTNPNVFYYTSGNQFIKGTITGTAPNATISPAVLATFVGYSSVVIPADEDISNDGLHIWLADCFQDCTGNVFLVTLNAGNGAATSAATGAVMSAVNHHKLQIVPNNGVSVEGSGPRTIYNTNGTVYSVPGGGTGNHTDWSLDSSGKMVAVSLWFDGTAPNGCPSNWGIGLLDLASNTVQLCINDGIELVGQAWHISARDMRSQDWTVFSADDSGTTCPSSSFYCFNNSTNMTGWRPYSGEILIWDTSFSNTVRLAHHRSRTDETYWAQTRASLSRTGKYVVFDSNYNQSSTAGGANYTDVYVLGPLY